MAQFHSRGIERDGVLRELCRRCEDELRIGVDESLDQPGRRDAIDMWTRSCHPSTTVKCREVEGGLGLMAQRFWTSGTHSDDLLETSHLGSAWGGEKVDVSDALVILGKPRQLLLDPWVLRRGLLLKPLEGLAIARRELSVVEVARLVEQAQYVVLTDVLDLLDPNEGRLPAVALDLLREPLEVFVPLRRVRQEVGRALERHRAKRPQSAPDAHAEARWAGRHSYQQEEKRRAQAHEAMKQ